MTHGFIEDLANDVLFSAASIREIAIKAGLRKPGFIAGPDEVADAARATGFTELVVDAGRGRAGGLAAAAPP